MGGSCHCAGRMVCVIHMGCAACAAQLRRWQYGLERLGVSDCSAVHAMVIGAYRLGGQVGWSR